MTYIIVAVILFAVYSYFASWIDKNWLGGHDTFAVTVGFGLFACVLWPLTLTVIVVCLPFYFIMKWGASNRGDII